jgi:YHS domain-containing protein
MAFVFDSSNYAKGVNMKTIISLLVMTWAITGWAEVPVQNDRNEAEYNNQYTPVLDGYDPVSYFKEGGGAPVKGRNDISFTYGTRSYLFASEANLGLFKANPQKYEPSYGSWCAYGMSHNAKIPINPLIFTVSGNRLHFFVSKAAKRNFDGDVQSHEDEADTHWFNFSGEAPRQ